MAFGRARQSSEGRAMQVLPFGNWDSGYSSASGRQVTPTSAEQLLTVFGCVQFISDTVATLPRGVFTDSPDQTPVKSPPAWFKQPNPNTSMTEMIGQLMWSLLINGTAFCPYTIDGSFRTAGFNCLDPSQVEVREEPPGSGQVKKFLNGKLLPQNVKQINGLMHPAALRGISPIEAARQSISIGLEAQDFAARFYNNGAHLSGVITSPRDFTRDQARDLLDKFGRDHSGGNAHKPGLLDGGAAWQPLSVSPAEAQFLESRKYQAAEIAGQMFLLDPTMLGIEINTRNLTYANLEQRGIHFVTFTLLRWLVRLEEFLTDLLPAPQYMKFNVAGLMRADLKTRYEAHQIALGGPQGTGKAWLTVEEVRDIEDLGPEPAELKKQNAADPPPTVTTAPTFPPPPPNGKKPVPVSN